MGRWLVRCLVWCVVSLVTSVSFADQDPALEPLVHEGFRLAQSGQTAEAQAVFRRVLQIQPQQSDALVQVAMQEMKAPATTALAFERLELALSDDAWPRPFSLETVQGVTLAAMVARQAWEKKDYSKSERFFKKAAASSHAGDCQRAQLATHVSPYPRSERHADAMITRYHLQMDALLKQERIHLQSVDNDPQVFCLLTAFHHSFYYRADWRTTLGKSHQLAIKAFPQLAYVAPHLAKIDDGETRECGSRIRLGVASAFFQDDNSVMSDFRGVIDRLPRDEFEVYVIRFVGEARGVFIPYTGLEKDEVLTFDKRQPSWLDSARAQIGALKLDVLLFLDLTMSQMATTLAMSRLARIQATSHGHPTTSGIDGSVMHYYISWGAAELPSAAEHYTERLALLPANAMHQYLAHRALNGTSSQDGMRFSHLVREDFASDVPSDGHWYLCMQKPFKRQPEFDGMLKAILDLDPHARLLLHDLESAPARSLYRARLRKAGLDLARVHLVPVQPHHRLMALYVLADVVLDSFPASGCTTTREALEVGAPVVTLPAKYLGSRWSLAYYTIMGVEGLVATDAADYARIAVDVACNVSTRNRARESIKANVHKLFHQHAAVTNWQAILHQIATKAL